MRPRGRSGGSGQNAATRAAKIVRLGAQGPGAEGQVTIVAASSAESSAGAGVTWEAELLVIDLDARALVDQVATALLLDHRETLMSGLRPDRGGAQKPISARARSRKGRLSPWRGFATGYTADELRRTRITGSAKAASTSVAMPAARNAFALEEAKRGIYYLSTGGRKAEVIRRSVAIWLAECTRGARLRQDAERRAKDAAGG